MNKLIIIGSIFVLGLSAAACNQAKSPTAVQRDVSKAEADRTAKVAEARKDGNQAIERQQKDVDSQQRDVAAERRDVNDAVANKNYEVAIAKADGDYKVSTQECEALSGSQQSACKERAEAVHKAAKADAEVLKTNR
jgi:hypothetical protein